MLKIFVCFGKTNLRMLFILFNVLDLTLYAVGILKCSIIIYDGRHGESSLPGLSSGQCIAFGLITVGFMVVLSAWSCVQIARFLHKNSAIEANQKFYFILKIILGVGLVVVPLILMEVMNASVVYTVICILINLLQISWAIQIYMEINRQLKEKNPEVNVRCPVPINSNYGFTEIERQQTFPDKTA